MRYLLASDLHYSLPQLDWNSSLAGEFDAVDLAGDHLDVVGRAEVNAQIALMTAYLARLAGTTTVIVASGNHDLTERRSDGEKAAAWLRGLDPRLHVDGATVAAGPDLVSVCAWWEGPVARAEVEGQLRAVAGQSRDGAWIWVYHSPPDRSPKRSSSTAGMRPKMSGR